MIIERNTFQLHFGKAKEAIAIWKDMMTEMRNHKDSPDMRVLSDLSGSAYTLVLEMHLNSFNDIGIKNYQWMTNDKFSELYQKFIPLCRSAHREYFRIEDEISRK